MVERKILLAHCSKTNRKFCLEVEKKLSDFEVVNFIDLKDEEYNSLISEITINSLKTAHNLIPCKYCQSRKIAGCSCNRKHKQCISKSKYDFQCLYCDLLVLDPPKSAKKRIYVTSMHYDDIGSVLSSMNLEYLPYSGDFDCDILFINCGTHDCIASNELAAFVKNGGCLYASDLASAHIEAAFPGMISYSNSGNVCKLKADVVDDELRQIAGEQIEIEFDLGCWSLLDKTQGRVLLRGSDGEAYAGKPIMVSFSYGKGTVFYTSFHNHAQASDKEKMLLQLLLLKQIGTLSNQSIEQIGSLIGLNIMSMKERFKTEK